jgi:hypothetical protein
MEGMSLPPALQECYEHMLEEKREMRIKDTGAGIMLKHEGSVIQ